MAVELVVKIDENLYREIQRGNYGVSTSNTCAYAIRNGTPLEKHDEEIIKETVASIWGKPPYNEVLDKIRAEIEQMPSELTTDGRRMIRRESVFRIIEKYKKGDKK